MKILMAAVLALGLGGCATDARIERRAEEKRQAWQEANPGVELSHAKAEEIWREAAAEVMAEAAREREEAVEKGAGVVSAALRGDWVAAGFGILGLFGLGVSAVKKARGAA